MQKRNVSIFIAGATVLSYERMALKAIANDLNGEFEPRGLTVSIRSYENFDEDQVEYDNFIKNEADLVIFVFNGQIGEQTKNEFVVATNNFQHTGHPRIMVFMHDYEEVTKEIAFIQGLMCVTTKEYWISYKNSDDLLHKSEKKIRKFLNEYTPPKKKIEISPKLKKGILILFSALCFIGLGVWGCAKFIAKEPILILVGGGSVSNYIHQTPPYSNFDFLNRKDCFYLSMPSSNAWQTISDEVFRAAKTNADDRRFLPVALSAKKATDSDFLKKIPETDFTLTGRVISYKLGIDTLCVFIKANTDQIFNSIGIKKTDNNISIGNLFYLIKKAKDFGIILFTTTEGSGTLTTYEEGLKSIDSTFVISDYVESKYYKYFSDESSLTYLDFDNKGENFLILGSKYYYPLALEPKIDSKRIFKLNVIDTNKQIITKDLYMYFMAYNAGEETYKIQNPIYKMLKTMGIKDLDKKVKNGLIKSQGKSTVLEFEKLPNWPTSQR